MNFDLSPETIQALYEKGLTMSLEFVPNFLAALLVLVVGWMIIRLIVRALRRTFDRVDLDPALESFIASLAGIGLKVILLVMVAAMLGVQTTSLVALLGAAGLAIGLALQGSLSNFAGGVLILVFKPFKIGDYITAQGEGGTVQQIQIFNTILHTIDNSVVVIPNGALANDKIMNYSALQDRRLEFKFDIGYDDDIKKAKSIIEKEIADDKRVFKEDPDRQPEIVVSELGSSSVVLRCRVWLKNEDYWPLYLEKLETVKLAFDQAGITIPFPQRDVHHFYEDGAPQTAKSD